MELLILWFFLIISAIFFWVGLKRFPIQDWLLTFFFTAYFSNFIGTLVVKFNLVKYLELGSYINAGQPFELLVFPVVVSYFRRTSNRLNFKNAFFQVFLYAMSLTIIEVILERYTNLIEYVHWHWLCTFLAFIVFMLIVRFVMLFINSKTEK